MHALCVVLLFFKKERQASKQAGLLILVLVSDFYYYYYPFFSIWIGTYDGRGGKFFSICFHFFLFLFLLKYRLVSFV
ncbi:hypothetical protein B0T24DRAFT_635025 [Lasiosphaeria ovina]|uniref:Uncharacterized protein n=1 Tax=Lasiosphaeria ovina TaxID=92902 RepID=A0AAE0N1X8_9PEZI|nr:hypothetical protein B0T24DRAFT_635025 [Lasiosphaeria ovina]